MKKLLALVLLLVSVASAAETAIPAAGRVVDTTGTLTATQINSLSAKSSRLEQSTGTVAVSLIVDTTGNETIDDFSMRVAEKWHPGKAVIDQAVVLVIAKADKKWAIKTSRNTGVTLTDVRAKATLTKMGSYLKGHPGDFAGAIDMFYTEISPYVISDASTVAATTPPTATKPESSEFSTALLIGAIFAVFGLSIIAMIWWMTTKNACMRLKRPKFTPPTQSIITPKSPPMHGYNSNPPKTSPILSGSAVASHGRSTYSTSPTRSTRPVTPTPRPTPARRASYDDDIPSYTPVFVPTSTSRTSSSSDDSDSWRNKSSDTFDSFSSSSSSSSDSFDGGGSSGSFDD